MFTHIKNLLFKNQTNRQTFAKNTFWMTFGNLSGRLIRAGIIIYAARILGAGGWGLFSYGITLVTFLTVFVDIGIDSIMLRESAKAKEDLVRQGQIISTSLFIKLVLLAIGVSVVLFVAPLFAVLPGVKRLFGFMAAVLVFDSLRNFGFSIIRSKEKMELEAALYMLTNVAIVAAGIISLHLRPTVMSFTASYAFGTAMGMLATFYVLKKEAVKAFSHFSKPLVKEILYSAWPFAVSGVLGLLLLNTDILIIGQLRSAQDVGFYSAAVRIVQLLYLFGNIMSLSSLPIFSRFVKEEHEKIKTALRNILRFSLAFSIPIALLGITAGGPIIDFVFGKEYSPATLSFQVLLLTLAFNSLASVLGNIVFVYNKQKMLTIYTAIGGFLNVILDLMLIPRFGINGSAFATLFSSIISDAFLWYITWRIVRFDINLKIGRILSASVISSTFLFVLLKAGIHVIISAPVAGLTYIVILYLLKEPLLKEIKSILRTSSSS